MELWDLYDPDRKPLNKTHPRGTWLKEGERHIIVNIWTVNSEGNILLTLRDPHKDPWPNVWENTGGSVLAGESSLEGAVRELAEETGILIEKDDLTLLAEKEGKHAFVDLYLVEKDVDLKDLILQEGETVDCKWVTLQELEEMSQKELVASPLTWQIKTLQAYFHSHANE